MNEMLMLLASAPQTGDTFPVKPLIIAVGIAAVIAVASAVIAGKNKKNKDE